MPPLRSLCFSFFSSHLVRVEAGVVKDELNILVQPPDNIYWRKFTEIHGISWRDTINAPNFASVWPQILPFIQGQTVVAHNGTFDFNCLRQTLTHYNLPEPEYRPACTYRIYKKSLAVLCAELGIALNHHDALSDAQACAELYKAHLNGLKV